jgi:superfamily I DNA and/or RNA helicase
MYDSALIAHESVSDQTLHNLLIPNKQSNEPQPYKFPVLLYIDTAGCDMEEENEEDGNSIRNPGEANLVFTHVQALLSAGVGTQDIGIITPYSAQVALLRSIRNEKFKQDLEIGTIDGFQGREKEAIIISMVRSNDNKEVGFLSDERRMNVAITRAKRHCVLIGDSETISSNDFLNNLLEHFQDYGDYESAASYAM